MNKLYAIVVTFHPNVETFFRLLTLLSPQVEKILQIDNATPDLGENNVVINNLDKIINIKNVGVAAAYNQGIMKARLEGATHVMLFDQDSLPAEDLIQVMLSVLGKVTRDGVKVAALGPNYTDAKGSYQSPFVKIKGLRLVRLDTGRKESVEVDHLISSGCLIDLEALNEIGPFEDRLFIDYVDTEWCLRARHLGYKLLGVTNAKMVHDLGDHFIKIFGKYIPTHSPLRHYYIMRNGIWLIRQSWVGWRWRILDSIRLLKIFLVFSCFSKNKRLDHLKMMVRGFVHGIRGRLGKL